MKNVEIEKVLRGIASDNKDGMLLPEDVVEAARPKKHPLHFYFEWSDSKAAHAYRLNQARHVISVCVTVVHPEIDPQRVFVSLSSDRPEARGYRLLVDVMNDEQQREQLLRDALTELNTFTRKYGQLKQLAAVFDAIRTTTKAA